MPGSGIASRLRDALQDTPGLVSGYLFGSAAEGREHRESDIDVAVLLDRQIYPAARDRFEQQLRLIGTLQEATHRSVDLVVLNEAPPLLARRITTEGQRLLIIDTDADYAFRRLTLSRAADLEPFLRRTRALKLQAIAP